MPSPNDVIVIVVKRFRRVRIAGYSYPEAFYQLVRCKRSDRERVFKALDRTFVS